MSIYFISDCHLSLEVSKEYQRLYRWLTSLDDIEELYILGDFFDLYVGFDANNNLHQTIAKLFAQLSKKITIYFMPGNRDFLMTPQCCQKFSMHLLADHSIINLYKQDFLLTHGDRLCQQDKQYQYFRKIIQHPSMRTAILKLPITLRLRLAKHLQKQTKKISRKNYQAGITDTCPHTITKWLATYPAKHLIHGHTHKPIHQQLNQQHRWVLSDWQSQPTTVVRAGNDGSVTLCECE